MQCKINPNNTYRFSCRLKKVAQFHFWFVVLIFSLKGNFFFFLQNPYTFFPFSLVIQYSVALFFFREKLFKTQCFLKTPVGKPFKRITGINFCLLVLLLWLICWSTTLGVEVITNTIVGSQYYNQTPSSKQMGLTWEEECCAENSWKNNGWVYSIFVHPPPPAYSFYILDSSRIFYIWAQRRQRVTRCIQL